MDKNFNKDLIKNITVEWLTQKGNLQLRKNDRKINLNGKEINLYSLREAGLLCRRNRDRFLQDYLRAGFEAWQIGKKTFIPDESLRRYQDFFIVKG